MDSALERAKEFAREFISKYPQHKEQVIDYLGLMDAEIECGESPENEYNLFVGSCEDLLIE